MVDAMQRKPTKPDDPEQSKRFIQTAEEVGAGYGYQWPCSEARF
jgi:hypothetical protein